MICELNEDGPGIRRCIHCGRVVKSNFPAHKIVAECGLRTSTPRTPEQLAADEAKWARQQMQAKHGAGTQLHRIISTWFGEGITAQCSCGRHISEMNSQGPEWCRDNVEKIHGWLVDEIARRAQAEPSAGWILRLGSKAIPGRKKLICHLIRRSIRLAERDLRAANTSPAP